MDYEKKYKKALGRCKKLYDEFKTMHHNHAMEDLEEIFPELAESEDERIRKTIYNFLDSALGKDLLQRKCGLNPDSVLAWLEKQKEQKPAEWSEEDERFIRDAIAAVEAFYTEGRGQEELVSWLKSLRSQPHKEIYQAVKHDLAIKFMNYLDENRPEGKISLSNGECEDIDKAFKENDWEKILRYVEKYGKDN